MEKQKSTTTIKRFNSKPTHSLATRVINFTLLSTILFLAMNMHVNGTTCSTVGVDYVFFGNITIQPTYRAFRATAMRIDHFFVSGRNILWPVVPVRPPLTLPSYTNMSTKYMCY